MLAKTFGNNTSLIPLLLRIGAGLTFLFTGIAKLGAPPVAFFTQLGIPAPEIMAPFIAILETVGGLMLLFGFGTRLAAALLICDMLVAIFASKMSGPQGFMTLGLPNGWNALFIISFCDNNGLNLKTTLKLIAKRNLLQGKILI